MAAKSNGHKKDPDVLTAQENADLSALASTRTYEHLVKEINNSGVDHPYIAKKLKEQLEAMETKLFAHQGVVMSSVDLINYAARAEGIKLYLSITGAVAPKQEKVEHAGVIVYKPDPRIQKKVTGE